MPALLLPRACGMRRVTAWASGVRQHAKPARPADPPASHPAAAFPALLAQHDTWACCWTADRAKIYHCSGGVEVRDARGRRTGAVDALAHGAQALLLAATGLHHVALFGGDNALASPHTASSQRTSPERPPTPWLLAVTGDGVARVLSASDVLHQGLHSKEDAFLDRLGGCDAA